jgi:hypothetical protein
MFFWRLFLFQKFYNYNYLLHMSAMPVSTASSLSQQGVGMSCHRRFITRYLKQKGPQGLY